LQYLDLSPTCFRGPSIEPLRWLTSMPQQPQRAFRHRRHP
jgi:hypothetical protein